MTSLELDPIPVVARAEAVARWDAGDADGFLSLASNTESLWLLYVNVSHITSENRARGFFERALLYALTGTRTNNHGYSRRVMDVLLEIADRDRLRALGDPLPGPGPYTVYRGVAGNGAARRVRGLSWTGSKGKAVWFAQRFATLLPDPAVFEVTVPASGVLAYTNERQEDEFLVQVPAAVRPRRLRITESEWLAAAERGVVFA